MVSNDTDVELLYPLQLTVTANGYNLNYSVLVQMHNDVKILSGKCNDIAHILIFDFLLSTWNCLLLSCNMTYDGYKFSLPNGIHCYNDFDSFIPYDILTVTPGYCLATILLVTQKIALMVTVVLHLTLLASVLLQMYHIQLAMNSVFFTGLA